MARSVEERDASSVVEFYVVGSDVLCDTSGFSGNHIGVADIVEQRCLTVVYVAHYGHDRRTGHKFVFGILFLMYGFDHFGRYEFSLVAEFVGYDIDGLGVESLVD